MPAIDVMLTLCWLVAFKEAVDAAAETEELLTTIVVGRSEPLELTDDACCKLLLAVVDTVVRLLFPVNELLGIVGGSRKSVCGCCCKSADRADGESWVALFRRFCCWYCCCCWFIQLDIVDRVSREDFKSCCCCCCCFANAEEDDPLLREEEFDLELEETLSDTEGLIMEAEELVLGTIRGKMKGCCVGV